MSTTPDNTQQYLRQFSCIIADASGNGIEFSEFEAFLHDMARKVRPARSPCASQGWDDVIG